MRRLQIGVRVLCAVLLALMARIVLDGVEPLSGVTTLIVGGLLLVTLTLQRQGRRLEPGGEPARPPPRDDQ